jgi:hypothetical protein
MAAEDSHPYELSRVKILALGQCASSVTVVL